MALKLPIYLDYNATTPVDPRVLDVMWSYFGEKFGNAASSHHAVGWVAEEAVKSARAQVARLIGAQPEEIVFTSGATESNNLALKGVFEMYATKGNHIITCVAEHKAVLDPCRVLEKRGGTVTYLPIREDGLIDLQELEEAITPKTILIAIMYGNNETGVMQPVHEISRIARSHNVLFFSDATQAVGKVPVNVHEDGIDLLSLSAHKIYGPKGVGALYIRRKNPRVRLTPQIDGGEHERGLRSGTLNVPGIAGLGKACDICTSDMSEEHQRLNFMRNKLENALLELQGVHRNAAAAQRLPHVTNLYFEDINGNELLIEVCKHVAISSGSACTSAHPEPSHVLKALGRSDEQTRSSLRFSLGRFTTEEQIDFTIKLVSEAAAKLQSANRQLRAIQH